MCKITSIVVLTCLLWAPCALAFFSVEQAPSDTDPLAVTADEDFNERQLADNNAMIRSEEDQNTIASSPPKSPEGTQVPLSGEAVVHVGHGVALPVQSFGTDIFLEDAVSMVVPQGWDVNFKRGAEYLKKAKVTWGRSGSWTDVLAQFADQVGGAFIIFWSGSQLDVVTKHSLSAEVEPVHIRPATNPNEFEVVRRKRIVRDQNGRVLEERIIDFDAMDPQVMDDEIYIAATPSADTWTLEAGSLMNQIKQWVERAGYQLTWEASHDLDITTTAQVQGDVKEAIRKIFSGLRHAGFKFFAKFYDANRVVVVRSE